ncbi:hypothetical protein SAMN02745912_02863 [Paramaledivibacter caminithermalis DSM 15212]|uniref:Uncharacterized protein n=1 Tax=Paramaledivibacter caminithermalis (strain DSM 15212 / CIP 107654 / DViRD3) TaxID=1121301 RepID=A0A1M6R6Z5_PARC5|nr:hypothetical protein SAMN02745912_02863 [Paramaledivibacter caminithermalis DSM 15212]
MRNYYTLMLFSFAFYYFFRYYFDKSLPLVPILTRCKNSYDIIDGIFVWIILLIGLFIGFFVLGFIDKIFLK